MSGGRSDYLSRGVAASALAVFSLCFLAPAFAQAQQTERVYRIGYLTGGSAAARVPFLAAFKQGMQELGYVEGRNLILEARSADGKFEQLPSLARELIARKPDVLFVSTTPASLAAKAATATVPIVFVGVADPLGVGLVPNLARPGANITPALPISSPSSPANAWRFSRSIRTIRTRRFRSGTHGMPPRR
jgi:ABC-type uncharacterized transport system substrate-binding protein